MTVQKIVWCQFQWVHPVVHLPPQIHPVLLKPLPHYPHGNKGAAMRAAWLQYRHESPGIVWVDGDVAIDPWTLRAMNAAIRGNPANVYTGMAWLWPPNPVQKAPMASHRSWVGQHAQWGAVHDDGQIDYFSFNCTYIPNRLMQRVETQQRWGELVFPWADTRLSQIAAESPRIPMYLVPEARVTHINWG